MSSMFNFDETKKHGSYNENLDIGELQKSVKHDTMGVENKSGGRYDAGQENTYEQHNVSRRPQKCSGSNEKTYSKNGNGRRIQEENGRDTERTGSTSFLGAAGKHRITKDLAITPQKGTAEEFASREFSSYGINTTKSGFVNRKIWYF